MKKSFFIFSIVFLLTFVLIYSIKQNQRQEQINTIKKLYTSKVQDNLTSISLAYFQWNFMYNIVEKDLKDKVQELFEEITFHYPYVESVQIILTEKIDFEIYQINSYDDKLKVQFKVFNDDMTEFVKNKVVDIVINPQMILESLGIDWIKISSVGKDFAFGLKYQITKSVVDYTCFLISFLSAALFVMYISFSESKRKLKVEEKSKEEEKLQKKINQAILELSMDLLKHHENEQIYQKMLEKMIQTIPNAQGGSVLIKKDDKFRYVAAVGFDLNELSKISFEDNVERIWIKPPYTLKKRKDIITIYDKVDPGMLPLMRKVGKIDNIMCTVSVPIEINGETVLIINFDNFSDENAFNQASVELARLFANYLGVVFERIRLEGKIKEQYEEMVYLSSHDPLTGLMNRRSFQEYGEKLLALAKREGKKVSLLFLDLSDFKPINDKYSHIFGDQVLKIIGSRIERSLRESDLVARFGGDEFVVLAYNCAEQDVKHLAQKLAYFIQEPIEYEGKTISVGVNIGIAIYPDHSQDLDGLVRLADMAMYNAKRDKLIYSLIDRMNLI